MWLNQAGPSKPSKRGLTTHVFVLRLGGALSETMILAASATAAVRQVGPGMQTRTSTQATRAIQVHCASYLPRRFPCESVPFKLALRRQVSLYLSGGIDICFRRLFLFSFTVPLSFWTEHIHRRIGDIKLRAWFVTQFNSAPSSRSSQLPSSGSQL